MRAGPAMLRTLRCVRSARSPARPGRNVYAELRRPRPELILCAPRGPAEPCCAALRCAGTRCWWPPTGPAPRSLAATPAACECRPTPVAAAPRPAPLLHTVTEQKKHRTGIPPHLHVLGRDAPPAAAARDFGAHRRPSMPPQTPHCSFQIAYHAAPAAPPAPQRRATTPS